MVGRGLGAGGKTHLELSVVCVGGDYWISFQRRLPGEIQRRLSGKCRPHSTGGGALSGGGVGVKLPPSQQ